MQDKYDVIVIGAGIGGLTAAAILAKNGKKVLVLEKNPVAGGYAVNFRRGEFEFDASLHMIDGCIEGGNSWEVLSSLGILNDIELVKPQYLYRSIFPDFDYRVPQCNLDKYINDLGGFFPTEKRNLERFFKKAADLSCKIRAFFDYKESSFSGSLFRNLKSFELLFYQNKTLKQMLDDFFRDQRLKAILSQLWPYYGLAPHRLASMCFCYATYDFLKHGGYYIKGGAETLSNALYKIVVQNNGKILLNTSVTKIILKNRQAEGVITNQGEQYLSDFIISGIDAHKTFFELIDPVSIPAKYTNRIQKLEPSISLFQIYLGLNENLSAKGFTDYEVFCNPDYDLDSHYGACMRGNDANNVSFSFSFYSNIDKNYCPKDKFIMGITTLSGYEYWAELSREDYHSAKQRMAEALIRRTEKIIPNLKSYIQTMEIATPLTMERYTGSYKGAVYGWGQTVNQCGMNRLNNVTPVDNLLLASAWTWLGGGIFSVLYAGARAAYKITGKRTQ